MVKGLPYGHGVDWWALGIMIYVMLTGTYPFYDTDDHKLDEKIKNQEVTYPEGISKEAKLIMRKVSVNSKTDGLKVLQSRATICPPFYLYMSSFRTQKFLFGHVFKNFSSPGC